MCKWKDVECPHNGPICEPGLTEPAVFHTAAALSIITVPFIFGPKSFSSFCRTPGLEHLSNTSLGQCPGGILAKWLIQGRSALCLPHLSFSSEYFAERDLLVPRKCPPRADTLGILRTRSRAVDLEDCDSFF